MYLPASEGGVPRLDDAHERVPRSRDLVMAARKVRIPVIFVQEVHRPDMIDFGRELDGDEDVHCIEGRKSTEIAAEEVGLSARRLPDRCLRALHIRGRPPT